MIGPASGRWTCRHKEAVVHAIRSAQISRAVAKGRFGLTDEELDSWFRRFGAYGRPGLQQQLIQHLRA